MAALDSGTLAPEFTLPTLDGKLISLTEARKQGPVLLLFFKVSCPVCQYAAPFIERVYRANHDDRITVLGISQDNAAKTRQFLREYGVTFPVAIDDLDSYTVSNAYGLTNVPTAFLIDANGGVDVSSVGWSKQDVETINARLAAYRNASPTALWRKGEDIRDFRAG